MPNVIQLKDTNYRVLYECEAENTLEALKKAVEARVSLAGFYAEGLFETGGASLAGVDFTGSDFSHVSLRDSDLGCCIFTQADLHEADLSGCNLRHACFVGADLSGAKLEGATLNWSQPELVSEVLFQAAGEDLKKLKVAMLVSAARRAGWCWRNYFDLKHPGTRWALSVLEPFVRDETIVPPLLRDAVQKFREARDRAGAV